MPLYSIITQSDALGSDGRARLADEITRFHVDYAGVPANWVHIVFNEYPDGHGFTAGRASATVALTLVIRIGRSPDYKRGMLERLWSLLQAVTGAPDEGIVIGIHEVPGSNAMEMGRIMPDVASP